MPRWCLLFLFCMVSAVALAQPPAQVAPEEAGFDATKLAAIDAEIGRILARVGDDTTVIVLAGHGMLHKRGAQFLLPEVLARLGVSVLATTPAPSPVERVDAALGWLWQRTPASVRRPLSGVRTRVQTWIDNPVLGDTLVEKGGGTVLRLDKDVPIHRRAIGDDFETTILEQVFRAGAERQ